MSKGSLPDFGDMVRAVREPLSGVAFIARLVKRHEAWAEVERWDSSVSESELEQGECLVPVVPLPLPDATVLDYVVATSKPTYLPQGEEGSEWCLAGARCALFLPLPHSDPCGASSTPGCSEAHGSAGTPDSPEVRGSAGTPDSPEAHTSTRPSAKAHPSHSLLYITGRTVDAFSRKGVQRAAAQLERLINHSE